MVCPVTQEDCPAAKNRTPLAMSSGFPSRRSGDARDELALAFLAVALPLPLGRRVGQDEAGGDAVHRDAERPELVRHLPGEPDLAGLRAGVGLDPGPADAQAGGGGDVDDPAASGVPSCPARPRGCRGKRWSGWRRPPRASRRRTPPRAGGRPGRRRPPALLTRMSTAPSPAKNSRTAAGVGQVDGILVDAVHGRAVRRGAPRRWRRRCRAPCRSRRRSCRSGSSSPDPSSSDPAVLQ